MAKRRYGGASTPVDRGTSARVLDAADALVRAGRFHTATVDDLAEQAGVARATVFAKFGSRLGVLTALYDRCAASPESAALRRALAFDDPIERLNASIAAGCRSWEAWGPLHQHLRAIVVLEPDVHPLIDRQQQLHRESVVALARQLDERHLLREGVTARRAAAALHMLTGLEAFLDLRHQGGLGLGQAIQTITQLAHALIRTARASGDGDR